MGRLADAGTATAGNRIDCTAAANVETDRCTAEKADYTNPFACTENAATASAGLE